MINSATIIYTISFYVFCTSLIISQVLKVRYDGSVLSKNRINVMRCISAAFAIVFWLAIISMLIQGDPRKTVTLMVEHKSMIIFGVAAIIFYFSGRSKKSETA